MVTYREIAIHDVAHADHAPRTLRMIVEAEDPTTTASTTPARAL